MPRNPDGLGRKPHKWRGRWRAYLTLGYAASGKPDRLYVYGRTEAECLARQLEALDRHRKGQVARPAPETLAAYLEAWLAGKAAEVKPRTLAIFRHDLWPIFELLGRRRLSKLRPDEIQKALHEVVGMTREYYPNGRVKKDGAPRAPRRVTLTAKTANNARATLYNALDDAATLGLIPFNPVERVKPLKVEERELELWTAAQVMAFTAATRAAAADYHALFYMALTTGMRPGELIALEWADITGDTVTVRRTASIDGRVGAPKTRAGRRSIPLGGDTLETLAEHRAGLQQHGLLDRLVFPTSAGTMVTHSNLRRSLHVWARKAEVPLLSPHGLRHTYASMAISAGMDVAELARRLGHTNPAFTLRQYVHFFEQARSRPAPSLRELTGHDDRAGVQTGGTSPSGHPN